MRFVSGIVLIVTLLTTPAAAQVRRGFWFNGALGYGTQGCQDCDSREGGFSGGLSLGGTLTPKWLLGVGTAGWVKSEGGLTRTVGTLDARVRFYPSTTGGFFLTGGMGVGDIRASGFGETHGETGLGVLLGLGVDLRVGSGLSLTPFWNGFVVSNDHTDANVGQIGLSLTVHKFTPPTPSTPAEQKPQP